MRRPLYDDPPPTGQGRVNGRVQSLMQVGRWCALFPFAFSYALNTDTVFSFACSFVTFISLRLVMWNLTANSLHTHMHHHSSGTYVLRLPSTCGNTADSPPKLTRGASVHQQDAMSRASCLAYIVVPSRHRPSLECDSKTSSGCGNCEPQTPCLCKAQRRPVGHRAAAAAHHWPLGWVANVGNCTTALTGRSPMRRVMAARSAVPTGRLGFG